MMKVSHFELEETGWLSASVGYDCLQLPLYGQHSMRQDIFPAPLPQAIHWQILPLDPVRYWSTGYCMVHHVLLHVDICMHPSACTLGLVCEADSNMHQCHSALFRKLGSQHYHRPDHPRSTTAVRMEVAGEPAYEGCACYDVSIGRLVSLVVGWHSLCLLLLTPDKYHIHKRDAVCTDI